MAADIGAWIVAKVIADATLTGLIGSRIYPEWAPQQDAVPFVTYSVVERPHGVNKTERSRWAMVAVEFRTWGADYDQIKEIDRAIQDVFDFGEGVAGGVTVDGANWAESRVAQSEQMERLVCVSNFTFRMLR